MPLILPPRPPQTHDLPRNEVVPISDQSRSPGDHSSSESSSSSVTGSPYARPQISGPSIHVPPSANNQTRTRPPNPHTPQGSPTKRQFDNLIHPSNKKKRRVEKVNAPSKSSSPRTTFYQTASSVPQAFGPSLLGIAAPLIQNAPHVASGLGFQSNSGPSNAFAVKPPPPARTLTFNPNQTGASQRATTALYPLPPDSCTIDPYSNRAPSVLYSNGPQSPPAPYPNDSTSYRSSPGPNANNPHSDRPSPASYTKNRSPNKPSAAVGTRNAYSSAHYRFETGKTPDNVTNGPLKSKPNPKPSGKSTGQKRPSITGNNAQGKPPTDYPKNYLNTARGSGRYAPPRVVEIEQIPTSTGGSLIYNVPPGSVTRRGYAGGIHGDKALTDRSFIAQVRPPPGYWPSTWTRGYPVVRTAEHAPVAEQRGLSLAQRVAVAAVVKPVVQRDDYPYFFETLMVEGSVASVAKK